MHHGLLKLFTFLSYQYVILGKKNINIETEIIDEYAPDLIDAIIAFATFFDNEEEKRV